GARTLIIDAKYYAQNMRRRFESSREKLNSANLYQIYAYVDNWAREPGETVDGMLLYAKTDAPVQPNCEYKFANGSKITAKTLDLDQDFEKIRAALDAIAAEYFPETERREGF
ncbi:MAG: hypothetical protein HUK22_06730, partial [Thermoguttaceae bacterium]|nr:hypothetical protein [Thermoguttaceae bacterium]